MLILAMYLLLGYIWTMKLASNDFYEQDESLWNGVMIFHLHVVLWLPFAILRLIDSIHRSEQNKVARRKQRFK